MKTKYLAILLCAAFVLHGCNDSFLDRIPLDELTDETYWETEEHLILASNACINYLRGKSRSVDMEFLGDNVFRERSSEYKTLGSGNFTSCRSSIRSGRPIMTVSDVAITFLKITNVLKRFLHL